MLCCGDNYYGLFIFTETRDWKLKDAVLTCAAIKARENLVENTVLALQAMLLREKWC